MKVGSNDQLVKPGSSDHMTTKSQWSPNAGLFFGVLILWGIGYGTVWKRLKTELDGVVIASEDIPPTRDARYVTEYTLRDTDGTQSTYMAGPTDASLPRSMPVGTRLKKLRWQVNYERNGERIYDFSLPFYLVIVAFGIWCLGWAGWRTLRPNAKRNPIRYS
jgi:hypothetical protein